MKKNLLLHGSIGIGKSTIIRHCLLPHLPAVGGFFVRRLFKGSDLFGFSLSAVGSAADYNFAIDLEDCQVEDNVFLYCCEDRGWQSKVAVFAEKGREILASSARGGKKLILLDELGGIELNDPVFMAEVDRVLDGSLYVLAVVKSPPNARVLERVAVGQGVCAANSLFISELKKRSDTELLDVDQIGREKTRARVKDFVEVIFGV